jgi:hypothetical protein
MVSQVFEMYGEATESRVVIAWSFVLLLGVHGDRASDQLSPNHTMIYMLRRGYA